MKTIVNLSTKTVASVPLTDTDIGIIAADKQARELQAPIKQAQAEILRLEGEVSQRRQREAGSDTAGGSTAGRTWMKAQMDKIAVERGKLT